MVPDNATWTPHPAARFSRGRAPNRPVTGVVQHYTAAGNGRALARWLGRKDDPTVRVSAHLIITRSGEVLQQVRFADRAWHAGTRKGRGDFWLGQEDPPFNVNDITIGLENSNYGALKEVAGVILTPYGKPYKGPAPIAAPDHRGVTRLWEPFTDELVAANIKALRFIGEWMEDNPSLAVPLTRAAVLGHSDVSPRRKVDPGPLFPGDYILDEVFGSVAPVEKPSVISVPPPGYGAGDVISLIGRDPVEDAGEMSWVTESRGDGGSYFEGLCLAPDEDTQD